jgi:hypothetical protein
MVVSIAACDRVFELRELEPVRGDGAIGLNDTLLDDVAPPSDATDAHSALCPPDFVTLSTGTYKYFTGPLTWDQARGACNALSGTAFLFVHLAVLTSHAEVATVEDNLGAGTLPFVGAYDADVDGTGWRHVTNEASAMPWDSGGGQPDAPGGQNCAAIHNRNGLDDDYCAAAKSYVCECDSRSDGPPP